MRRPTIAQARAIGESLKARRLAMQPLYDAIHAAKEAGDRDAWFEAVNAARVADAPPMAPLTRAEFDERNPA